MNRFVLIGAGMGTPEGLTGEARGAIGRADTVLATERLANGLRPLRADIRTVAFTALAETALACEGETAILLSGDTGFFSAAGRLRERLLPHGEVQVLPGLSSIQVLCARLGVRYDDAFLCSAHGRDTSLLGAVSYHSDVLALTGGKQRAQDICRELVRARLEHVRVTVGENLGAENERVLTSTPDVLAKIPFGDLCVLHIYNDIPADASHALRDTDFARADVPMTKQEVRWLACDLLDVRETDTVYDIGAGTGSVSMELARRARHGRVFAIECRPEALSLIERNRMRTGNYHVKIIFGTAPEGLDDLPAPDCAFIGGSRGNLDAIVQALLTRNPAVRMVISAISLETLHEAVSILEKRGLSPEVTCVNIARARKAGSYHLMTAQNPVYLIGN